MRIVDSGVNSSCAALGEDGVVMSEESEVLPSLGVVHSSHIGAMSDKVTYFFSIFSSKTINLKPANIHYTKNVNSK